LSLVFPLPPFLTSEVLNMSSVSSIDKLSQSINKKSPFNINTINGGTVDEIFCTAFAYFVGVNKKYTTKQFSHLTEGRISPRTAHEYEQGLYGPSKENLAITISVLRAEFTNKFLEGFGLTGTHELEPGDTNIEEMVLMVNEVDYLLTRDWGIDHNLDHREWPEFEKAAEGFIAHYRAEKAKRNR